jgi:hypothetical protein
MRGDLLFAFGTAAGPRSGVWAVDTEPAKGDVYIAPQQMMHAFKTSLHGSGQWRMAYTEQYAASAASPLPPGIDRVVHRAKPADWIAPGALRMVGVVVPWFSVVPADPPPAGVVWLDPPPDGWSANVTLVAFDAVAPNDSDWAGRQAVGTTLMRSLPFNGTAGRLDVVYVHRPVTADERSLFRNWTPLIDSPQRATMRQLLLSGDPHDVRVWFEVVQPYDPNVVPLAPMSPVPPTSPAPPSR